MTEKERAQLRRHEEWISRPVKELFPIPLGYKKRLICKGCGKEFIWTPTSGRHRIWCSSACKTQVQRTKYQGAPGLRKNGPSQPSPPGPGGGLGDGLPG